MANLDKGLWAQQKVLVTGHTGFKGSWLVAMLRELGAPTIGVALQPPTQPNHYSLLPAPEQNFIQDIRDLSELKTIFAKTQPTVVFHMAAQSLVVPSYEDPVATYSTNVMGTLNVLEASRQTPSVRAVIIVTSDKCYENREWAWSYRENDAMGGYDPYSSSKGCAELLTKSYRQSFLHPEQYNKDHKILVASVRAGNVIGGGDWSDYRLIPDAVAAFQDKRSLAVRNIDAIRPWQHVLDPLGGYMLLAEKLVQGHSQFAKGWNFGPSLSNCITVGEILQKIQKHWPDFQFTASESPYHEAKFLMLDSSQAFRELGWHPRLTLEQTLDWTVAWYDGYLKDHRTATTEQVRAFLDTQL